MANEYADNPSLIVDISRGYFLFASLGGVLGRVPEPADRLEWYGIQSQSIVMTDSGPVVHY